MVTLVFVAGNQDEWKWVFAIHIYELCFLPASDQVSKQTNERENLLKRIFLDSSSTLSVTVIFLKKETL